MSRKRSFKASICFVLVVAIMLSFNVSTVFAASTKVVTVTKSYSTYAPLQAVSIIQNGVASSTYNYDDGSYKGILNFVRISNWTQTYDHYDANSHQDMYKILYDVTYSGTVTAYPATKTVTVTNSYSTYAPLQAVSIIQNGVASSTYNYDDGSYKGILNFVRISSWTQTYDHYDANSHQDMYKILYEVTYSGTVTQY